MEAIATSSKKLLGWRSWCSLGAAWLDPDPTNYSSTGAPIQRRLEASQLDGRFARPAFQHGWTNPFGLDPTREAPGSQRLRSNHRTDAGTLSGDAPNVVVTHASKNLETRSDSLTPCSFFEMNILATSGYTILTRPMIIENASEPFRNNVHAFSRFSQVFNPFPPPVAAQLHGTSVALQPRP